MIRSAWAHAAFFTLAALCTALPAPAAAKRLVRFATGEAPYRAGFEAIARDYEALHPDVEVRIQMIPTDGYATWIRTAVAGGPDTCPDIFNINNASGYFESGKAISLRPYLDSVNPYAGLPWRGMFHAQYLAMLRNQDDDPAVPLNFIEVGFYYNKTIWKKAGLTGPPATWEEFMTQCEKVRAAGFIPVAMPADFENTWAGTFGWMVRIFTDAFFFHRLEHVRTQPGDFAFDPKTDGARLDPKDRTSDLLINVSQERFMQAILDGDLRFDGPEMRAVYGMIRDFGRHWQRGSSGHDLNHCYFRLFLAGRAAVFLHTSAGALQWDNEMARLAPASRFEVGVFGFPPVATSGTLAAIPFRGTGAPIPIYGILKTNRAQQDLAADFLMFLTTPKSARKLLDKVVEAKLSVVGPFAIKDVPLPPGMEEKFLPFLGRGREKMQLRGLYDEQQSTWRWALAAQDHLGGRLTVDEFLAEYQLSVVQTIPRLVKLYDLDMDPVTRDNNAALVAEIAPAAREAGTSVTATGGSAAGGSGAATTRDAAAFAAAMASSLKLSGGRQTTVSAELAATVGTAPGLVMERTIAVAFAPDEASFARMNEPAAARRISAGYQYLAVVELSGPVPRVTSHHWRPARTAVVGKMQGKRYGRAELERIWGPTAGD